MRAPLLLAALVALAAVLATAGARDGSFVYDDEYYLLKNPAVSGEADPWTSPLGEASQSLWRPLTVATWRWQWPATGPASARPLLTANIALHAAAAVLLMLLARRFGLAPIPSAFAGLAFAVHPVHAEAVAWISGRSAAARCPGDVWPCRRVRWPPCGWRARRCCRSCSRPTTRPSPDCPWRTAPSWPCRSSGVRWGC